MTYAEQIDSKLAAVTGKDADTAKLIAKEWGSQGVVIWHSFHCVLQEATYGRLFGETPLPPLEKIFDTHLRSIFENIIGKDITAKVRKVAARMTKYIYSSGFYRRSFRTALPSPHAIKFLPLIHCLYFDWKEFDYVKYLQNPPKSALGQERSEVFPYCFDEFLALEIDEGNTAVIEFIKDILLGGNGTLLTADILNAVVKCENEELHNALIQLLLAAKLQEGLRQSILEVADHGTVAAFILLLRTVLDNDLLRYSSAKRAVMVWMGMGYDGDTDTRQVKKLAELGLKYLTDKKERTAALDSKDALEIFAALWAIGVEEVNNLDKPLEKLMASGEKYRKLTALYFVHQLGGEAEEFKIQIAKKYLNETDHDLLAYILTLFSFHAYYGHNECNQDAVQRSCQTVLKNISVRDRAELFELFCRIVPSIPSKGIDITGKPFEWCGISFSQSKVFNDLMTLAGCDFAPEKIGRILELIPAASGDAKASFIKVFLDPPHNSKERDFVYSCFKDRSMAVRSDALKVFRKLAESGSPLSESEKTGIIDLLALKTGDIRQEVLQIIFALPENGAEEAAGHLLADKNVNKRLAGLDIILQLIKKDKLSRSSAAEMLDKMSGEPAAEEKILISQIRQSGGTALQYTAENGFGLYDPQYVPAVDAAEFDKQCPVITAKNLPFNFDEKRLIKIFTDLCKHIETNKDYTFQYELYDGRMVDITLGSIEYTAQLLVKRDNKRGLSGWTLDDIILLEVWRAWLKENKVTLPEILVLHYVVSYNNVWSEWNKPYKWEDELYKKYFNKDAVQKLAVELDKIEFAKQAKSVLEIIHHEFPAAEQTNLYYGFLKYLLKEIPAEDWNRQVDTSARFAKPLRYCNTFQQLISNLFRPAVEDDDKLFVPYFAITLQMGAGLNPNIDGYCYGSAFEIDTARAVSLGLIKKDAFFRLIFECNNILNSLTGNSSSSWKKYTQKYPVIWEVVNAAVARILEIELKRGDTKTAVSSLAMQIRKHCGVKNFAGILTALGKETFVRGYIWNGKHTKKDVMSSLLRASVPDETDTVQTLKDAFHGRFPEQRLLEAAMYSPVWLPLIAEYLNWDGLASAAWYFHAHTNETLSAEKETYAARYSPITPEEFKDGAFDIDWFNEAYKTLGKERFEILYECAKYISSGANHRRAQLFADAVLGKLDKKTLPAEIKKTRNKDKLLSYSLVPLDKKREKDLLERYEFIQGFLKESKQFGTQRRASESKAGELALGNLARNAGYADVLRFSWKMEILKIDAVRQYFEPKTIGKYNVFIEVADDGSASLITEKDGKRLKSLPAELKKDEYTAECKEIVAGLKDQFRRARTSLESAMVKGDSFTYSELTDLMQHPIISPLLCKLIFITDKDKTGTFAELKELTADTPCRIAHPFDLYRTKTWSAWQKWAFDNKVIQPFKQVFRELYLMNEDERNEKTVSRRYAGHQVQPKKTVALLKTRGWTVDNYDGLQRVCYRENLIARMYAAADWFSPADIESPTLEAVQFCNRKTGETVKLEDVPPVLFSEVMRDIDLVVSVAHVGGVDPEASFSTVEMRAAIVRELFTLLKLQNVSLDGRFVKIKGTLGEYSLHLGSGSIQMTGKGSVNILAVPSQHRGRIFLPFADDDPRTAEIMSKALLLAEDTQIKDPAILGQIR